MRWNLDELILELRADPERRVLFVEGTSDLAFWRELVPEAERRNVVVYPIGVVHVDGANGERDRLLKCAEQFLVNHLVDRALFFADADFDRVLGRPAADNVVLTDGRDLESYLLLGDGLRVVCLRSSDPEEKSRMLNDTLQSVGLRIAFLRLGSEVHSFHLPFKSTLEGRLSRFLDKSGVLDAARLSRALLQNCSLGLSRLVDVLESVAQCEAAYSSVDAAQLIHGKDLTAVIAWQMDWGEDETAVILSLALVANVRSVSSLPALARVREWAVAA